MSTAICRLRPLVFFPASNPRLDCGTVSAPCTDWESMIAADGSGVRPSRTQVRSRSGVVDALPHPARTKRAEIAHTVVAGGNSDSSCRIADTHLTAEDLLFTVSETTQLCQAAGLAFSEMVGSGSARRAAGSPRRAGLAPDRAPRTGTSEAGSVCASPVRSNGVLTDPVHLASVHAVVSVHACMP